MLKNILRWCRITGYGSDANQFPVQQIEYHGKTSDAFFMLPFGLHANVDPGSMGLLMAIAADRSSKAVLPLDPLNRPKPLGQGEVALYHPGTGSIIHFKSNGDLLIDTVKKANGAITINSANATVKATGSITIDSPSTTVTGSLTVSGSTTLAGVTSNGKNIGDTHTHLGSPSAPSGPVSNTGVVI